MCAPGRACTCPYPPAWVIRETVSDTELPLTLPHLSVSNAIVKIAGIIYNKGSVTKDFQGCKNRHLDKVSFHFPLWQTEQEALVVRLSCIRPGTITGFAETQPLGGFALQAPLSHTVSVSIQENSIYLRMWACAPAKSSCPPRVHVPLAAAASCTRCSACGSLVWPQ